MRLLFLCCVLLIWTNFAVDASSKRGRSKSRGGTKHTSSGDCGWFCSSNSKKSAPPPKQPAAPAPKPSAPKPSAPNSDTFIKKETAHTQQSSNVQRPIGWNVPGTNNQHQNTQNSGWKSGYQSPGSAPHQQSSYSPTAHQPQGALPSSGQGIHTQQHSYPQQQGHPQQHGYPQQNGYPQQHGYPQQNGYPQQHGYPQQNGYPQQHGYPQQNGYPQQHGYGANPAPGQYGGMGGYNGYHGMGGYPQQGGYGGMGGYTGMGGYGHHGMGGYQGGMMGGFGGMGGMGSPYGMYKKKSFFSGSTIANVVAGMFVYHMASNLVSGLFGGGSSKRPVNVYNYYNQPEAKEEMKLPSNLLTLCEGDVTKLCTTGTTAICTSNNTVLCVAVMAHAQPCAEENALCVNTTIPCLDPTNPICQNATQTQNETPVNLPCFTNLTVDVNLLNETNSGQNKDFKYCVTTMAVAGPEYQTCNDTDKISDYRSVLEENYKWSLTIHPLRRPYSIYDFKHPTETPSGEVVMPMEVLIPCVENATKLCLPGVTPICTTFSEIMCLESISSAIFCEKYNTTCLKRKVPCLEDDPLCKEKTEEELVKESDKTFLSVDLPCFANITVNSHLPNFDIAIFNGTIPETANTSYTYHYHYCITTLGIPGPESDVCTTISDEKSSPK